MVNYDLPWNPNRLEQRFGRIHRIGQTEACHLWTIVADETRLVLDSIRDRFPPVRHQEVNAGRAPKNVTRTEKQASYCLDVSQLAEILVIWRRSNHPRSLPGLGAVTRSAPTG